MNISETGQEDAASQISNYVAAVYQFPAHHQLEKIASGSSRACFKQRIQGVVEVLAFAKAYMTPWIKDGACANQERVGGEIMCGVANRYWARPR